jgi:hypothetical protein
MRAIGGALLAYRQLSNAAFQFPLRIGGTLLSKHKPTHVIPVTFQTSRLIL